MEMEMGYERHQRVYREGGRELLRAVFVSPVWGELPERARMAAFYGGLTERLAAFVEERLFPARLSELSEMPERMRKFSVPRRVFSVEIREQTVGEELLVTVTVSLLERGRELFRHAETQIWAKRAEMYEMVPKKRKRIKKTANKDTICS